MKGEVRLWLRRYRKVVAFAAVGLVTGASLMWLSLSWFTIDESIVESVPDTRSEVISEIGAPVPTRITIPSVGIEAPFGIPLRVDVNQAIEVPAGYEEVAYYEYGPRPGELGPAVVLGHVDSFIGPAVFYELRDVVVGDVIEIERADGTTAVFTITDIQEHQQSGFPTERVYGDIDHAGLRLITCSGYFDHGIQRYSHNLIVFATLNEIRQSG